MVVLVTGMFQGWHCCALCVKVMRSPGAYTVLIKQPSQWITLPCTNMEVVMSPKALLHNPHWKNEIFPSVWRERERGLTYHQKTSVIMFSSLTDFFEQWGVWTRVGVLYLKTVWVAVDLWVIDCDLDISINWLVTVWTNGFAIPAGERGSSSILSTVKTSLS